MVYLLIIRSLLVFAKCLNEYLMSWCPLLSLSLSCGGLREWQHILLHNNTQQHSGVVGQEAQRTNRELLSV